MTNTRIYMDEYAWQERVRRYTWVLVRAVAFAPARGFLFNQWRLALLRAFGAKFGRGCKVAAGCAIWAPWNVVAGDFVCLADGVDCYSAARITLGDYSTISQRAFLCSASHDVRSLRRPLTSAPIAIGAHAWICAEAFVGPGVVVGDGAVIGARAVALRDVEAWTVSVGNPARKVKDRVCADVGATLR